MEALVCILVPPKLVSRRYGHQRMAFVAELLPLLQEGFPGFFGFSAITATSTSKFQFSMRWVKLQKSAGSTEYVG